MEEDDLVALQVIERIATSLEEAARKPKMIQLTVPEALRMMAVVLRKTSLRAIITDKKATP